MKSLQEIAEEAQKQRRLLWYVDWIRWRRQHSTENLSTDEFEKVYKPAVMFADTIDHYYKEEIDTHRFFEATDNDRAKLLGQVTALAWVLELTLEFLSEQSGPEKGEDLPTLP